MIHFDVRADLGLDLQHRAAILTRIVRGSPSFTGALRWWLGFDLVRNSSEPDAEHELGERDALLLDAPPGTPALICKGYLVSPFRSVQLRLAKVTALVHISVPGLDLQQKAAPHDATVPLGKLLLDANRHAHYAYRLDGPPIDDQPGLRSRATLLRAGRPVALLTRCDRTPADLPGYVQAPIRIGLAS
ncbi:hypothetical protein [Amycolatopsis camponoti]|nr:hypothetical protein [Amycolatopsis camponoti]